MSENNRTGHKRQNRLNKNGTKLFTNPPTSLNLYSQNKCISIGAKTNKLALRNSQRVREREREGQNVKCHSISPYHLMTTFISQQRAQQSIKSQLAFIVLSYLTVLIPPVWNACALFRPNGSRRGGLGGGAGGVTVFQRSLTLLPGEMESLLSPLRASVNDGVLPCHRCVFILNGLTGRRSDRR